MATAYGTNYKPFAYVNPCDVVKYLVEKAGWTIRQRDADNGVVVCPIKADDGAEIVLPVYRSHTTSALSWWVNADSLHRWPGILNTLAAIYGGTARDMAAEISQTYESIVGRDNHGRVKWAVFFGLTQIAPEGILFKGVRQFVEGNDLRVVFTMREGLENGEECTCYGFARAEEDVPAGGCIEYR